MPAYRFYRLEQAQEQVKVTTLVLFNDVAAIRRAVTKAFPQGCDVWQGQRFVGRFHRAEAHRREQPE